VALALRSRTGIYRLFLLLGLVAFVVGSFIEGDQDINVPVGVYLLSLRLFCQPDSHLALSLHGALLPVVVSVMLIGILLPGKSDVLGLVLTTLAVVLVAYLCSNVELGRGIVASGSFLGAFSALLVQLQIIVRIALSKAANHVEINLAIRSLGQPISAIAVPSPRPISLSYISNPQEGGRLPPDIGST